MLTVDATHSEVCKFEDDDDKYEPVKRAIGRLADAAVALKREHADVQATAGSVIHDRT